MTGGGGDDDGCGVDGAGGGGDGQTINLPGNGGSGIIIIRLPTASYASSTGSPNVATIGSDTVLRFTSSGTFTTQ